MLVNNNLTQCALLAAAGLQNRLLLPETKGYIDRQASYWAANTPLGPKCIVHPRTTDEVSQVVRLLNTVEGVFALRSGGHTQWTGSNDISNGVTIDLGRMTEVTYNVQTGLASIQPGPKWADVYQILLEHGVCVTGGREGNVGVAGFLTGGGNSYYAGLYGLGCDSVANFEVVLASGEVVNANATSNPDLWTALKGGSGNFGVVTRFDMYAFPAHDLWGGIRVANSSEGDNLAELTVKFTAENFKDPQAAFIFNYNYNAAMSTEVLAAHVVVSTDGSKNSSALGDILRVPAISSDITTRSMWNMSASYNSPRRQHQVWFSLTFKNDVEIIKLANKMQLQLVEGLKVLLPPRNFTIQCLFQPMPTLIADHSVRRGGNVLGLDKARENALLWLLDGSTETPAESTIMRQMMTEFKMRLEDYAKDEDLLVDWQYLNYVDHTQQPLEGYGQSNVDFLRQVAKKYDPTGVFQNKIVSGWKVSKVQSAKLNLARSS